jgi:hypothetical protein
VSNLATDERGREEDRVPSSSVTFISLCADEREESPRGVLQETPA